MMAQSIRILILEDNPADAELVQFELAEAGIAFTPKVVTTKKDYVHELHEFSPDLILSDYDLPQYTGALALVAAKTLCPQVPFILVTGSDAADNGLCREMLANGAGECVLKDHLEQLAPAIQKVLMQNNGCAVTAGKRES
jgi:CheY-like chemotaxis protein